MHGQPTAIGLENLGFVHAFIVLQPLRLQPILLHLGLGDRKLYVAVSSVGLDHHNRHSIAGIVIYISEMLEVFTGNKAVTLDANIYHETFVAHLKNNAFTQLSTPGFIKFQRFFRQAFHRERIYGAAFYLFHCQLLFHQILQKSKYFYSISDLYKFQCIVS